MTHLFSLIKIEESVRNASYDCIVLDMPASGEALRYLYFPKLAGSIGSRLIGFTGAFSGFAKMFQPFPSFSPTPSNVIENEMDLLKRLENLSKLIMDPAITSIRLIANPDTFSIENAKRALMYANLYGINVDLAIINKIMPKGSPDRYFANWAEYQNSRVEDAKANFYPLPIREARLYETELRGVDMMRNNAEEIFGKGDPSHIFYSEKVFEFTKQDSSLLMNLRVPFSDKDDFEIHRSGEYLTVKVKGPVGYFVNIIPLPVATMGMKLAYAKFIQGKLEVLFQKEHFVI